MVAGFLSPVGKNGNILDELKIRGTKTNPPHPRTCYTTVSTILYRPVLL